ncbi:MAG TPA: hypothetical protein VEC01_04040 [Noviherbaspirillum sp.]|uniref:hypothetical protein n=1 Tax=Noviherbaspirillum sp. TaxID=1926288 RepID=UPI002D59FE2C|nr:hypothetical protein [Noviherbaspirillum sp.]HYD94472.1 hypothetical protein [Noviherbaspirillum sp.]
MTIMVQWITRPIPGASLPEFIEQAKRGISFWTKYKEAGAEMSFWATTGGEWGEFVFLARFPSYAAYGACHDKMLGDPEFAAWQAAALGSGTVDLIKSSISREIPL